MNRKSVPLWAMIASLVLAEVALTYEITMIYAALPRLNEVFGDRVKVGWLVTGFMMVSAAAAAVGGRLGDLYGRRRVVQIALLLALVGSTIGALSTTLPGVIAGRTLQGCAACVLPLCIGLVRELLPQRRVAFGVGIILASAAIGAGSGNLLGGYLIDHYVWSVLFYVSAGLAALALVAITACLPVPADSSREHVARLDLLGGLLFAPGLAALLYAVHELRQHGWHDASVIGWGVGGLAMLAAWIWQERRHPSPLIDVRTVFRGQVGLANLAMLLIAMSVFQMVLVTSMLIQQPVESGAGFGRSATFNGLIDLPGAALGILVAPLAGQFAGRYGARRLLLWTSLFCVGCWLVMIAAIDSLWALVTVKTLTSMLGAAALTGVPNLIIENSVATRTSELVGFATVVRHLFGGVGAQFVVMLLASQSQAVAGLAHPHPDAAAYQTVFAVFTLLSVATAGVVWCTRIPSAKTLQQIAIAKGH
jgi:MFS family permease